MEDNSEERGRISRGRTPDRLETTGINPQAPRRGSNLLAAAGIGYENRRRLSQQNAEAHGKVFQQGNQVGVVLVVNHYKDLEIEMIDLLESGFDIWIMFYEIRY